MTGCTGGRRRRHGRQSPTPARHIRVPLAQAFKFANNQAIRRSDTFASVASPAGMPIPIPSVKKHLESIYDGLKGPSDQLLSAEKLEAFIRNVQKDEPKPPFLDTYTFEQFHEFWWRNYSRAKRPLLRQDKVLDKPLSQYFINSSHNTYIAEGDQFLGENNDGQYKKVSLAKQLLPLPGDPSSGQLPGLGGDGVFSSG